MIRYIVEDESDEILDVASMYDRDGNDTNDPRSASAIVIKLAEDEWLSTEIDPNYIFTVH